MLYIADTNVDAYLISGDNAGEMRLYDDVYVAHDGGGDVVVDAVVDAVG